MLLSQLGCGPPPCLSSCAQVGCLEHLPLGLELDPERHLLPPGCRADMQVSLLVPFRLGGAALLSEPDSSDPAGCSVVAAHCGAIYQQARAEGLRALVGCLGDRWPLPCGL